jgi:hypothetical protein
MICFSIFFVSFIAFRKWGNDSALAGAGFITTTLSLLLRAAGLVGDWVTLVFIFITASAGFMMYYREK